MVGTMTTASRAELEREWDIFLSVLKPWEMHWLCKSGREMDWHDDLLAGAADFDAFRAVLDAEFPSPLVTVVTDEQ